MLKMNRNMVRFGKAVITGMGMAIGGAIGRGVSELAFSHVQTAATEVVVNGDVIDLDETSMNETAGGDQA